MTQLDTLFLTILPSFVCVCVSGWPLRPLSLFICSISLPFVLVSGGIFYILSLLFTFDLLLLPPRRLCFKIVMVS